MPAIHWGVRDVVWSVIVVALIKLISSCVSKERPILANRRDWPFTCQPHEYPPWQPLDCWSIKDSSDGHIDLKGFGKLYRQPSRFRFRNNLSANGESVAGGSARMCACSDRPSGIGTVLSSNMMNSDHR